MNLNVALPPLPEFPDEEQAAAAAVRVAAPAAPLSLRRVRRDTTESETDIAVTFRVSGARRSYVVLRCADCFPTSLGPGDLPVKTDLLSRLQTWQVWGRLRVCQWIA